MYKYSGQTQGIGEKSRLEKSGSIGGLSQLTIEREDFESDFGLEDTTEELRQRLEELEEITMSFLAERPLSLSSVVDSFADLDEQGSQDFEFFVPEFTRNDVLCLDVTCIPNTVDNNLGTRSLRTMLIKHEPLQVTLKGTESSQIFLPSYHNGEYEFVLTSAHGMTSGRFFLSVQNLGRAAQSIRAHLAVTPYIAATPLTDGETIVRRNLPRKAQFSYFRFLLQDPSQLLSIRVNSFRGDHGEESDPDIYISNKYSGLVQVNKENFIWRSAMIGSDQVDIHPTFDIRAKRGNTFLIGVIGQNDHLQDFSICVTACPPPLILPLLPTECFREVTIRSDAYSYFSVPVDGLSEGQIVLIIEPLSPTGESSSNSLLKFGSIDELSQQFGRGIYTEDSLVSSGVFLDRGKFNESEHNGVSIREAIEHQINGSISPIVECSPFFSVSIPLSVSKAVGLFPVAHFSDHCLYPTANFFTWRASGLSGDLKAYIEATEWKYSETNTCYFSLIGVRLPTDSTTASKSVKCRLTISSKLDSDSIDAEWRRRHEIYQEIFQDVDGCAISLLDRSRRNNIDDQSTERIDLQGLTYGEVDLLSFVAILKAAGARDNHIFADLGCGVGKTIVAAALSGIKFMRCIGIEFLPGLCQEAVKVISKTKRVVETVSSNDLRTHLPLMEIWEGDISDPSLRAWTNADTVYMSSLCFPDSLLQKVMVLARGMREGATLITLKLPESYSEYFDLHSSFWYKMTWGRVLVYFLRRNSNRQQKIANSVNS